MSPAQARALDELSPTYGIDFAPRADRFRACVRAAGAGRPRDRLRHGGDDGARLQPARPEHDFLGDRGARAGRRRVAEQVDGAGLAQRARDPARRGRGRRAHDCAGLARRRPRVLPRSVAEEAPSQAAAAARLRSCTRLRSGWRPAATCMRRPIGRTTRTRCWRRFGAEPLLANTADGFAPRPATRPQTKFEARGRKLGTAWDVLFTRSLRHLVFRRR